ncbi:MAG: hypothetical protein E6Q58_04295 [Niabella sp.]|nr:MAG: hypothetical protein E6Q58_04295 [Niabella sp.]
MTFEAAQNKIAELQAEADLYRRKALGLVLQNMQENAPTQTFDQYSESLIDIIVYNKGGEYTARDTIQTGTGQLGQLYNVRFVQRNPKANDDACIWFQRVPTNETNQHPKFWILHTSDGEKNNLHLAIERDPESSYPMPLTTEDDYAEFATELEAFHTEMTRLKTERFPKR